MKPTIILASQSIARKTLLEKLGLTIVAKPTDVDEDAIIFPDPKKTIIKRAQAKADAALSSLRATKDTSNIVIQRSDEIACLRRQASSDRHRTRNDVLIIAADSMATLGNDSFGKPRDLTDARQILSTLCGKTHVFVTHVVIVQIEGGREINRWEHTESTKVTMKQCTNDEIEEFIQTYKDILHRFAACFALDEMPWDLVVGVEGSYTNVIGLPFEAVLPVFRKLLPRL